MAVIAEYLREIAALFRSLSYPGRLLAGVTTAAAGLVLARLVLWLFAASPLHAVSGLVTYDGTAVAEGAIVFDPTGDGQRREALIRDGRYSLARESGLLRNAEYLVRVRAFRKTGRKYDNLDPARSFDEHEQYLPERYYSDPPIRVTATRRALSQGVNLTLVSGSGP
jgi:hypothetical protein